MDLNKFCLKKKFGPLLSSDAPLELLKAPSPFHFWPLQFFACFFCAILITYCNDCKSRLSGGAGGGGGRLISNCHTCNQGLNNFDSIQFLLNTFSHDCTF